MRIGLVAPPWIPVPPPAYGGIETIVDTLARGLTAAGHEVLLAASSDSTCPVERLAGIPIGDTASIGACVDELQHSILAYAGMADVDLIHDHTLAGALFRHRPENTPVVVTAHGPFADGLGEVYRAISRDASLIAISHHQASTAPASVVDRVIHHGLDASTVPVGPGDGGYACFLGRMHPSKGLHEAIKVAMLAGMPLRIAAKMHGPEECDYYSDVIEPLLGDQIEYVGELNRQDKYVLLGGAVALLNPIQWAEPFGMVMIESLATGTPVVSTPLGSAPELISDGTTGYLRNGPHALASALLAAAALDRRECRRVTEERFSADRMVAEHLRFYEELAEGGAGNDSVPLFVDALDEAPRRGDDRGGQGGLDDGTDDEGIEAPFKRLLEVGGEDD